MCSVSLSHCRCTACWAEFVGHCLVCKFVGFQCILAFFDHEGIVRRWKSPEIAFLYMTCSISASIDYFGRNDRTDFGTDAAVACTGLLDGRKLDGVLKGFAMTAAIVGLKLWLGHFVGKEPSS